MLPDLSLIIPAWNEAERLPEALAAVRAAAAGWGLSHEIIVVDDGSTDSTAALLCAEASRHPAIRPLAHPRNRGKGRAIATGVAASRGRWVVFFDADLSYPLSAVPEAIALLEGGADIVLGARNLAPTDGRRAYSPLRRLSSLAFNAFVEAVLNLGILDTQCGFKAFRGDIARDLFPTLVIDGFGFDVELLYAARQRGLTLTPLPIQMTGHRGSSVRVVQHGLQMARDVLRVRARSLLGRYGPSRR